MKINIEIDCTPQEARQAMGLPDVQKLQEEWLARMQDKIMASADGMSPDAIVQSWMSGASANMDVLSGMMAAFGPGGPKGK